MGCVPVCVGPFVFAVDHCFPIKGQGTVMTGTVLQGSTKIGEVRGYICCTSFEPSRGCLLVPLLDLLVSGAFLLLQNNTHAALHKCPLSSTALPRPVPSLPQSVEIPALKVTKKVRSMQMYRAPVHKAAQGDRVGICVTQFDSKLLERGLVCSPGHLPTIYGNCGGGVGRGGAL